MSDKDTWEALCTLYDEDSAKEALAEINFWEDNGRLPTWAVFIEKIEVVGGNVIYVHRDNRKQD